MALAIQKNNYLPLYSDSPYNKLQNIKMDILKTHASFNKFSENLMTTFDKRLMNLNKDIVLHYDDILLGLSNIFSQNQNLSGNIGIDGEYAIGIQGGSYGLTSKGAARQIANHIEVFNKTLDIIDKAITQIDTALTQGAGFDKAVAQLILAKDPEALSKIPDGMYSLPMSDIKTISTSYITLNNLVKQFENLGPAISAGTVSSEDIQTLMRGIAGSLNTIKGIIFEGESMIGLLQADIQGLENLHILNTGSTSASDIITILEDTNIKKAIEENRQLLNEILNLSTKAGGHPKADLTLTFGTAGGSGSLGISIKNSSGDMTAAANRYRNTVSIGSQANFYAQIHKAEPYLSELAGMNGLYYGKMAYSILSAPGDENNYNQYWKHYVDAVAVLNILDNLTGQGGFGNTAAYFVVNTRVFLMKDVLLKILNYPELIYGSTIQRNAESIQDKAFVDMERGITREEAAIQRSDKLHMEITRLFQTISLNTKIDMSLLGMLL